MEKQTYLILFGIESPIGGGIYPGQSYQYPIGLIEKKKFQTFIEEYKKKVEKHITDTFKKCSVDNDASFSKHEPHKLEGEINLYVSFEDGSTHEMKIRFSEFEPNVFEHNKQNYIL